MKNLSHCWNFMLVRMMFLYHPVYRLYHLLVLILLEMYSFIPTTCLGDSQPIWWAFQKQYRSSFWDTCMDKSVGVMIHCWDETCSSCWNKPIGSNWQALSGLTAGAPEALCRAVAQPFDTIWDFQVGILHCCWGLCSLWSLWMDGFS